MIRPTPMWLLGAPPCVWALVGAIALFAPGQLTRLFPILWPLHDVSLMLALTGAMWLIFRGAGSVGPVVDEWSVPEAKPQEETDTLEALLGRLARLLQAEAVALT